MPLIHCITDYILSLAISDFCRTLLQFTDVMNLMRRNVAMHSSMPKEDILAFTATQEYTHTIKFIWLILTTVRQNDDRPIVLDMLEFCYF